VRGSNGGTGVTARRACWRRADAVTAGIFLVVFAARCFWIDRAAAQVPVWDQWFAEFGRIYEPLLSGNLPLDAVAAEHNEHRLFTTRLISMALFLLSGYWDVKGEMVVSAAAWAAKAAVLWLVLGPLVGPRRRPGLALLVLAVCALPFSPLNLLSGIQVQFVLAEAFSIVALALVARPLDVERLCAVLFCLLLAFFSMATGIVAMAAAVAVIVARGWAGRSLPRAQAAAALFIAALAAFALFLTPRYAEYGPPSAAESARILVRGLSFPFPTASGWMILGHLPVILLAGRLCLARAPDDPGWRVLALAGWTTLLIGTMAVGRGATRTPGEQHLDVLALPLLWNYVAMIRLLDGHASPAPRVVRALPWAWAAAGCLFLAGQAWLHAVPRLREIQAARPIVEARFRESLASHDFSREIEEARRAADQTRAGDGSYVLYDPFGRYTIPLYALRFLPRHERPLARLFPPAVSGIGRPALFARALDLTAAAWPLFLLGGAVALWFGLRGRIGRA
jgi:hypothetical protein